MFEAKPTLLIYQNGGDPNSLAELCAGIEEEGVLFAVSKQTGTVNALAYQAANESLLHVGIGLDSSGAALQMKNCAISKPVLVVLGDDLPGYRRLGQNGARAVKGGMFL